MLASSSTVNTLLSHFPTFHPLFFVRSFSKNSAPLKTRIVSVRYRFNASSLSSSGVSDGSSGSTAYTILATGAGVTIIGVDGVFKLLIGAFSGFGFSSFAFLVG